MRLSLLACVALTACAHRPSASTYPHTHAPALILDGAVLSCEVQNTPVADTGCAALAFVTAIEVSFISAPEAVRYFGPAARYGAYVAQSPALDLTPLHTSGKVVPVTIVLNGNRYVCLQAQSGDARPVIGGPRVGPVFSCPVWDSLKTDGIAGVELVKPPRSIVLFGRDAAAYALILTPKQ